MTEVKHDETLEKLTILRGEAFRLSGWEKKFIRDLEKKKDLHKLDKNKNLVREIEQFCEKNRAKNREIDQFIDFFLRQE